MRDTLLWVRADVECGRISDQPPSEPCSCSKLLAVQGLAQHVFEILRCVLTKSQRCIFAKHSHKPKQTTTMPATHLHRSYSTPVSSMSTTQDEFSRWVCLARRNSSENAKKPLRPSQGMVRMPVRSSDAFFASQHMVRMPIRSTDK